MTEGTPADLLALAVENAELRMRLAELQDQLIEAAVDAGNLHADVENLQLQLSATERERNAWRLEAKRLSRSAA